MVDDVDAARNTEPECVIGHTTVFLEVGERKRRAAALPVDGDEMKNLQ
jgi:hypothetical protein